MELWRGGTRFVHLTVAGTDGAAVPAGTDLYANLVRAIDAQRDPTHRVEVATYTPRRFSLEASVQIDPRLVAADVLASVTAALGAAFAFARRGFGQPVTAAEVVTVMQGVTGVVAVDLDQLTLAPPTEPTLGQALAGPPATESRRAAAPTTLTKRPVSGEAPPAVLTSHPARMNADGTVAPAELLLINPAGIRLRERTL